MKLSKSLLQAIALGVTMGAAATSCSPPDADDIHPNLHAETCEADCDATHNAGDDGHTWDNCPACGLG